MSIYHNTQKNIRWLYGLAYWISILIGNVLVIRYGIVCVLGLCFPAGVVFVGLTFSFRDYVQRYWGDKYSLLWMLGATVVTLFLNIQVALASVSAFFVGELSDWLVFRYLKKSFCWRIVVSNLLSCPVDSFLFVALAFGIVWPAILGQAIVKVKYVSGLIVVPFVIVNNRKGRMGHEYE